MGQDTAEFVKRSKLIHGDKYDYSLVKYKNMSSKVEIKCKTHGIFKQSPGNHLYLKNGCPKCSGKIKLTTEEFIFKSKAAHGEKYDYSLSEYKSARKPIKIICNEHGEFECLASNHLNGHGCSKCAGVCRSTLEEFIIKANKIHDNLYDYSEAIYINNKSKIKIICNKHGEFFQKPDNHFQGKGCPKCSRRISKLETEWLDYLKVPQRQVSIKVDGSTLNVDGFNKDNNTVYEFYGDYWHGNLSTQKGDNINEISNLKFKNLYKATKKREEKIINAGYNLIYIWESEWKELRRKIKLQ